MGFSNVTAHLSIPKERTHRVALDLPRPAGVGQPAVTIRCAAVCAAFRAAQDKSEAVTGTSETHNLLRRQILAPNFAKHLIVGWENIYEADSTEPCQLSPEKAEELLMALAACEPADQFYTLTNAAFVLANFRDVAIDSDSLGK